MIALGQLIQVMSEKYYFLKKINSKSDLLKYFIEDEEMDGLFRIDPNVELDDEFIERFRGDVPSPKEMKKNKNRVFCINYQQRLFSSCFINYINSLEEAINFAEKMN